MSNTRRLLMPARLLRTLSLQYQNELKPLEQSFRGNGNLVDLVIDYWFPISNRFLCPVSGEFLNDPVYIIHSRISPVLYNRQSVIDAINSGELTSFGINLENMNFLMAEQRFITRSMNVEQQHDLRTLSGLVSLIESRGGSHLSFIAEIERERRAGRELLAPLLGNNPSPITVRTHVRAPNSVLPPWIPNLLRRFLQNLSLESLYLGVIATDLVLDNFIPLILGHDKRSAIARFIERLQYAVIQYQSQQFIHRPRHDQYTLFTDRYFIIAKAVTPFCLLNIFNEVILVALSSSGLSLCYPMIKLCMESMTFAFFLIAWSMSFAPGLFATPSIASTLAVFQDFASGRIREQINSLAVLSSLSFFMAADLIFSTERRMQWSNNSYLTAAVVARPFLRLPYAYLSARNTANTLVEAKEYLRNPRRLLRNQADPFAQDESLVIFASRNVLRLFAAFSAGFLVYTITENPLAAMLAILSVYMQGSLMYGLGKADSRYRLLPAVRPSVVSENQNSNLVPLSSVSITSLEIREVIDEHRDETLSSTPPILLSTFAHSQEGKEEQKREDGPASLLPAPSDDEFNNDNAQTPLLT
ncbi:MAG: hypothetical protein ABI597_10560, partial [Gammaproteobacteria bacterium]